MKKNLFIAFVMFLSTIIPTLAAKKTQMVERIDPPGWWVGMAEPTLQLMVYGKGINQAQVSLNYPGVALDSIVRLDGPDYLFLYLNIGKDTKPGTLDIKFTLGKKTQTVKYQLKQRDRAATDYPGFDSTDVLYLIMPDRFARGGNAAEEGNKSLKNPTQPNREKPNARHGGDIAGLRKHLNYIDTLGVTAIWVNPVLENDVRGGSYHGYATTDYYRIDPRFGTNTEWNEFVEEAHGKNLKVVMDMIFNHSGISHPWVENKPSNDWYNSADEYVQTNFRLNTVFDPYASDYDKMRTVDGWFVPGMPDLNQRNPHLMKYLIQNSIWWIEESKIDGIRMDTHPYADINGMANWIRAVEKEYPKFNIVGECWYNSEGAEAFWQKNSYVNRVANPELPTVMDFVLCMNARDYFNKSTKDGGGLNQLYDHLTLDYLFPDPSRILTFLDNHDTDRFLTEMPENLDSWKQAQAFLLTSRGIPQIYYGTEILMNGTRANGGDGMIRLDMPGGFPSDTISVFTKEGRSPLQQEAFDFLSTLLHYRRGSKALTGGTLKHFIPEQGVYTYERRYGDERVIVMMNGNDSPVSVDMKQTQEVLPYGSKLKDIITGEVITIAPKMDFPARALYILEDVRD